MLALAGRPAVSKYVPRSTCCSLLLPCWHLCTRHTARCSACCSLQAIFCYFFLRTRDVEPTSLPCKSRHDVYVVRTTTVRITDCSLPYCYLLRITGLLQRAGSSSSVIITVNRKSRSTRPYCCVQPYLAMVSYGMMRVRT